MLTTAMVNCAYDLHIHSCLSPCAQNDMTPNNIVGMAALKGLDVIAVSDHNSARNLPAVCAVAKRYDICVVPALEVQTREDVHVLTYFPDLGAALEFGEWVYSLLPPIQNKVSLFGEQLICDQADQVVGQEERLLIQAISASIDEVVRVVSGMGGVVVPAHINRMANSLISVLGFIPDALSFTAMEIARLAPAPKSDLADFILLY